MNKRLMVGLLVGGLMAMVLPGVTTAAQPAKGDLHIESDMTFLLPDYFPNSGDFVVSGPAYDDDILCEDGDVLDTSIKFGGFGASGKMQITVVKEFTCNDGSGTFFLKLQIYNDYVNGAERFSWVITGGTDDYARLRGSGSGYTTNGTESGNTNIYDGFVIN